MSKERFVFFVSVGFGDGMSFFLLCQSLHVFLFFKPSPFLLFSDSDDFGVFFLFEELLIRLDVEDFFDLGFGNADLIKKY